MLTKSWCRIPFCLLVLLLTALPAAAQLSSVPSPPLRNAYYAASEGRYEEALEEYLRILNAARDTTLIAEIAVQTGELYRVHQVAPDGHGLIASAEGGLLGFTVEGADTVGAEVHIYNVSAAGAASRQVAALEGSRPALWGGVLSDGRVAYLTYGDETAIETARLQMERARQRQSSLEFLAAQRQREWLEVTTAELRVRDLDTGEEVVTALEGRTPIDWTFDEEGQLLVAASVVDGSGSGLFRAGPAGALERVDRLSGYKSSVRMVQGGRLAIVEVPIEDPAPHEPGAQPSPPGDAAGFAVVDLRTGEGTLFDGSDPTVSADGSTLAFLKRPKDFVPDRMRYPHGPAGELWVAALDGGDPRRIWATDRPLRSPTLSPDGAWVGYAEKLDRDFEVFVRPTRGSEAPRRITNEIQHDLNPAFLGRGTLLVTKGESRHRRAYLYDFSGAPPLKLFDNNMLRTITPEYEWLVGPTGDWVAIVAERDGDTVSPERGVYTVDLTQRVTREELQTRLTANLDRERELAALAEARFGPIDDSVSAVTEQVSEARIYQYERALYSFGSKYVTQPGNRRARDYIAGALRNFGYNPALQEFEALPNVRSSNVIAELTGTEDPDLIYVISSHFDSSLRGPGSDDNSSGTAALLETARIMSLYPQRATIQFVFLTGEEAGLLGAREYVRQAQAAGLQIAGVLNNDMVGWMNDHRLDNTIRYSSVGIRDVQHAAASWYSNLITYDAKYYKNTDAHAFFDGYGDVVGGIGSYPVLGNPNYHQATDGLETVSHRLIAEVTRTTAATIMALAFGPSRPAGLTVQELASGGLRLGWSAPERAVRSYQIRYRSDETSEWTELTSTAPNVELPTLPDGAQIEVFSVTREGTLSWDAARVVIGSAGGA